MKNYRLKHDTKIRVTRDRVGALDSNSRSVFTSTVGDAIKEGDFDDCGGTMWTRAEVIEHENPDLLGADITLRGSQAFANVFEPWQGF